MKKLISILLTLAMVFSFAAVSASAETPSGSIVVNNYNDSVDIKIYKIFDLENYNAAAGTYPYKMRNEWKAFFEEGGAGAEYMNVDVAITWKGEETESRIADFAKKALAYAVDHNIDPVYTSKDIEIPEKAGHINIDGSTVTFSGLELGYYLVDSSMGALCGLTTTNPDGVINAKNGIPTVDKQVQEDLTSQWGEKNTADIGQEVNFRITINVHAGAQNYVLEDNMNGKFRFDGITSIEHTSSASNKTTTYKATPEEGELNITKILKENVSSTNESGKENATETFTVKFTDEFCSSLATNDKVVVYYAAMLNRYANVGNEEGNINSVKLKFGDHHTSASDETVTYTYGIDIVKTDNNNTLINGAEFRIYDAETGGNIVEVVELEKDPDNNVTVYRKARKGEAGTDIIVATGKVRVVGFDNGTYYLEETKAPTNYNKLTTRQSFTISDENLDATFTHEIYSKGSGVQVINKTGTMLPETGGTGTAMFITIGSITVIGAGVLLVTKKRMSMIEED